MAGSFCFALGSAPGLSAAIPSAVIGGVFFVGSLLFTSAAGLQLVSSMRARADGTTPGKAEVWAAAIQLVGTVWFNVNTFAAPADGPHDPRAGPSGVDPRHDRVSFASSSPAGPR
jgi:hypothetical protein